MKTNFKELESNVIQWGVDRDLYHPEHGATATSQLHKFFEEFGELNSAILKNDINGIKDAIGDCQVCLIHRAKFINEDLDVSYLSQVNYNEVCENFGKHVSIEETLFDTIDAVKNDISDSICMLEMVSAIFGFKPFECLEFAYNEIKYRKGKMINRTFVKDE